MIPSCEQFVTHNREQAVNVHLLQLPNSAFESTCSCRSTLFGYRPILYWV